MGSVPVLTDPCLYVRRKVREDAQRRAEAQAKQDEERLLELQRIQHQKEEEKRRRIVELQHHAKGNAASAVSRTKVAFKLNSKPAAGLL